MMSKGSSVKSIYLRKTSKLGLAISTLYAVCILPHMVAEVKHLFQGPIRQSSSSYASAVVLVKTKYGALRLCIDYHQLKAKCLKDVFLLPIFGGNEWDMFVVVTRSSPCVLPGDTAP